MVTVSIDLGCNLQYFFFPDLLYTSCLHTTGKIVERIKGQLVT